MVTIQRPCTGCGLKGSPHTHEIVKRGPFAPAYIRRVGDDLNKIYVYAPRSGAFVGDVFWGTRCDFDCTRFHKTTDGECPEGFIARRPGGPWGLVRKLFETEDDAVRFLINKVA